MQVRVKICGITNTADAIAAIEAGADALGFVFYEKSPRHVTSSQAAAIIRHLPPFISRVGLFVDTPIDLIQRTVLETGLDTLQFHGDESPEFCRHFHIATIKAIRVRSAESLRGAQGYPVTGILLDSFVAGHQGGTGVKFKWELALEAKRLGKPLVLAGGLNIGNVEQAVRTVNPYGVDVSSGVESSPGKKDVAKIRDFIAMAKASQA
ncbi:MAG: phosphoribosylanthranilate isomerase [Verrucomicrobia bacterium]|nr:phosphoribosylanthranilate isomerase [Verrucomicrobiota bacterium]MBI3870039.1 phosphoribosylanthranilate isomerase [Verrucomicrobiota bacterium]